jgi:hypothetical protein
LASTQPLELLNFLFAFPDGAGGILISQKESIICDPRSDTEDQVDVLIFIPTLAHPRFGVTC